MSSWPGLTTHGHRNTEFDLENELLWYTRNLSHVRTLSLRRGAPDGPPKKRAIKQAIDPCD
jgi:hypothetical protein